MRLLAGFLLGLLLCMPPLAGCGPAIPPEDLGTVLDDVPDIPDADQPDERPDSGSPPPSAGEPPPSAPAP